jgi:hypothetical protein
MRGFRDFIEANFYKGKEYRYPSTNGEQKYPDVNQMLNDIAADHNYDERLLVTHSPLNKIGLNPRTTHYTPVGQSFFPLNYAIKTGAISPQHYGDRRYIHIVRIKPDANVLMMTSTGAPNIKSPDFNLETYDFPYKQQLIKRCGGFDNFKKIFDQYFIKKGFETRSNYSILWVTVFGLSQMEKPLSMNTEYLPGFQAGARQRRSLMSERMTAIFTQMGIDGFYDKGTGSIHFNKPTQVQMLNLTKVEPVVTIDLLSNKSLNPERMTNVDTLFKQGTSAWTTANAPY